MGGYAINIPPSFELTQASSSTIGGINDQIIFNCTGLNAIRIQAIGALSTDSISVLVSMDGINFSTIQTVMGNTPFFCSVHNWVYAKIKPDNFSGTPYQIYWKGDTSNVTPKINQDGSINVNISATSVEDSDISRNFFGSVTGVPANIETQIVQYVVPPGKRAVIVRAEYSGEQIGLYKVYIDNIQQAARRTHHGIGLTGQFDFTDAISSGMIAPGGSTVKITVVHNRPGLGQFDGRIQIVEQITVV
jgi:hypothetical protein